MPAEKDFLTIFRRILFCSCFFFVFFAIIEIQHSVNKELISTQCSLLLAPENISSLLKKSENFWFPDSSKENIGKKRFSYWKPRVSVFRYFWFRYGSQPKHVAFRRQLQNYSIQNNLKSFSIKFSCSIVFFLFFFFLLPYEKLK